MVKTLHSIIRSLCHWALAGGFLLLLLLGGILLRLYIQPYALTPYMAAIEEWLDFSGYQMRLDELEISFDGRLHLEGTGIMLENPEGRPLTTAHKIDMVFSNRGWLAGKPSLRKVQLSGASIEIAAYNEAIIFDQFYIPLVSTAEEGTQEPRASLVEMLNHIKLPPQLADLQSVTLSQLLIRAHMYRDRQPGEEPTATPVWRFINSKLELSRKAGDTTFTIEADLESENVRTPLSGKITHKHKADVIAVEIGIDNPNPEVLNPLLPEALHNMIQAPVSVALYANIDANNHLQSPRFDLSFSEGKVHLPQVYREAVPFRQARIDGWYETETDLLRLNYLSLTHANGLKILGFGTFADLQNNIDTDLEIKISEGKLADVFSLVPDQIIPETLEWLKKTMDEDKAQLTDLQVLLRGPLKQMPFPGAENLNRLEINAGFKNLSFVPLEKLPPIVADGHMRLVNDTLLVQAAQAKLRKQQLQNVVVNVTEMNPYNPTQLKVKTQASGPLPDLVNIITGLTDSSMQFKNLSGTHKLEGTLDLKLTENVRFEDAQFDAVASIADLRMDVPYVDFPLVADVAAIQVTDKTLDFHAYGTLSGQLMNLKWHENMKNFGNETAAGIRFDPDVERRAILAEYGFAAEGALPTTLNLKRLDAESVEFDMESNLTEAVFGVEHFGWKKQANEEAILEARGRLMVDGSQLWVDWLSMRGPQLEILGSAAIPTNDLNSLTLQLNPFKIATTDAFVDYGNYKLVVIGPSLDLSHWPKGDKNAPDPVWETLDVDAQLQSLKTRSGKVKDFALKLQRRQQVWTMADMKAKLNGQGNLSIELAPTPENNLRLSVISNNAGEALKFLDISTHLRGGTLGANIIIEDQNGLWDWVASGRVDMGEVHLVQAPLLAKILSLLSIQQLLSREEGILFREVEGNFKLASKMLRVSNLRMSGPSLGLMFKGAIDFANDKMDMEGKLIPAEGLNRLVGSIPIIGTLVTGSQNALIAADFSVEGKIADPVISVNPLSVITPGLIKDIFGAIFGGSKEKEAEKKPQEK